MKKNWKAMMNSLRKRQDLRKGWYIERRDETKLLTSLGEICYSGTYFHNKETGEYCYLLDRLMGLESHARISEGCRSQNTGGGCGKQLPEKAESMHVSGNRR